MVSPARAGLVQAHQAKAKSVPAANPCHFMVMPSSMLRTRTPLPFPLFSLFADGTVPPAGHRWVL
jgi:hypothetical protein